MGTITTLAAEVPTISEQMALLTPTILAAAGDIALGLVGIAIGVVPIMLTWLGVSIGIKKGKQVIAKI